MDFSDIWQRAKHGTVSKQEIAAAESALHSSDAGDRHLPLLIIGLARKPEPSLVDLVRSFLIGGKMEAERYCALRVLCSYWSLWADYLPYVLDKISPEAFDADPGVADEAFNLIGTYLWKHPDREAWQRLVAVYDLAREAGNQDLADCAHKSMFDSLFGKKELLQREVRHEYRKDDPEVVNAARSKAGLAHQG